MRIHSTQLMLSNRLNNIGEQRTKSSERLSSGVMMNRASDNCSGLAIYQELEKRIRGLEQASRNTQDGMSLLQTMDGGLQEIQENIIKMRELTVQSNSDTLTDEDRSKIQLEINQIKKGIDDIASNTEFNNIKLLNQNANLTIKISDTPFVSMNVELFDCTSTSLNLDTIDVTTEAGRNASFGSIDNAQKNVLSNITLAGVKSNQLVHNYANISNQTSNLSSSEANIHDTNMAYESMKMVKTNILEDYTNALFNQCTKVSNGDLAILLN
ncbi:MAG: flagellin [Clostridiaceae bacterium]